MTQNDLTLELVNEEKIDVLYAWTGSYWLRIGEVKWCSYWWRAFFLGKDYYKNTVKADWLTERHRAAMGDTLLRHAHEHADQIIEFMRTNR